jgi:hypothetical protein
VPERSSPNGGTGRIGQSPNPEGGSSRLVICNRPVLSAVHRLWHAARPYAELGITCFHPGSVAGVVRRVGVNRIERFRVGDVLVPVSFRPTNRQTWLVRCWSTVTVFGTDDSAVPTIAVAVSHPERLTRHSSLGGPPVVVSSDGGLAAHHHLPFSLNGEKAGRQVLTAVRIHKASDEVA